MNNTDKIIGTLQFLKEEIAEGITKDGEVSKFLCQKIDELINELDNEVLTKREIFAKHAMQGLLAKEGWIGNEAISNINHITYASVRIADELIKRLEESKESSGIAVSNGRTYPPHEVK